MPQALFFNWKMNPTNFAAAQNLFQLLAEAAAASPEVTVVACVPSLFLQSFAAQKQAKNWTLGLGAQDVSAKESGALTGEICANMLADIGAQYVIIGHSETRELHRLTDEDINQKLQQAVVSGLIPIICIGFQADKTVTAVNYPELSKQIRLGLAGLESKGGDIYLAYEPVWAIGTGKTADNVIISQVLEFVRAELTQIGLLARTKLLYGGSVDETSLTNLMQINALDGFLVGGASLKPEKFQAMISSLANSTSKVSS